VACQTKKSSKKKGLREQVKVDWLDAGWKMRYNLLSVPLPNSSDLVGAGKTEKSRKKKGLRGQVAVKNT
jgi:hypothetical protein